MPLAFERSPHSSLHAFSASPLDRIRSRLWCATPQVSGLSNHQPPSHPRWSDDGCSPRPPRLGGAGAGQGRSGPVRPLLSRLGTPRPLRARFLVTPGGAARPKRDKRRTSGLKLVFRSGVGSGTRLDNEGQFYESSDHEALVMTEGHARGVDSKRRRPREELLERHFRFDAC